MQNNTQHTPTQHSTTVGGSAAARIMACPASLKLSDTMPKDRSSSFADEGTALHNCVEHCLVEGLSTQEAMGLVGTEFYGVAMTAEHIETCIIPSLLMFDEYMNRVEVEDGGILGYDIEVRVSIPDIEGAFGTADILITTPKRAVVWDWKFGGGVYVPAEGNKQMLFYAVGAQATAQKLFYGENHEDDSVRDVDIVICQPRISPVAPSIWSTDTATMDDFHVELIAKADEAMHADTPSYERGEHCRWCRAKPVCPFYADVAKQVLALKDANGAALPEDPKNIDEAFTQDELAHWLHIADVATTWAKAIQALAMSEAKAGLPPTGMKLVARMGNLSFVDKEHPEKVDALLARHGLSVAERRTPWKNITPTQAGKAIKKAGGKPLDPKKTHRVRTGETLVDVADKRAALSMGIPPKDLLDTLSSDVTG